MATTELVETAENTVTSAQTRLLLTLWDLGGTAVKKGELMKRIRTRGQSAASCAEVLSQLEQDDSLSLSGKKVQTISLEDKGKQRLGQGLKRDDFMFESNVGARTANALLKWIRENHSVDVGVTNGNGNGKKAMIESYEAFKPIVLEIYDRLDRDYNMDNLVPIYQIRREIGEQVSRSEFNEWLLKMQTGDICQLIGGEMPELTPDKAEDSIKTALGGVRYYVKRL